MSLETVEPAPTKRERTDDRRLAIALAARQLIIEKGLEGLRTRDIADRVGINVATLHYHVPTKEALLALVAETMRDHFAAQGQRRSRTGATPLRRLEMEFEDFRETLIETPGLVAVFAAMMDRARRNPELEDVITPIQAFWVSQFAAIFADGVTDGSFRPNLDTYAFARITTGALSDFWHRSPGDLASYDRLCAELILSALNPNSTRDPLP